MTDGYVVGGVILCDTLGEALELAADWQRVNGTIVSVEVAA
jgi:hypothetical protein